MPFATMRQVPRPAWAGRANDLQQWASQVVEKVRVGTTSGRLRFLPWYDPYTDETPEIRREYPKMLVESSVKAAFQTKVLAVISLPVTFNPPDDDDERQQEAARFSAWAFRKIHGGTSAAGWSILHPAVIKGLSVCEKVWEPAPERSSRWAGRRRYKVLKSKDTDFLQLGIDAYRNVTAIKGAGFNAGHIWNPEDFVLFSYMSLFENPSGMSDFRAAYRPYWIKHTVWQLRSLHLDKFVGPYLKGTYSTQDQKSALEAALEAARASTWFTIPAGVMVDAIDMSMRGTADFESALKDCDREILIAIVGAHLQILEGQTSGARGNTQVHKETAELIQWWLADRLARVYYDQMVCPLILENYHDVEPPEVSVGAVTEAAMIEQLKVDDGLQKLGWKLSRSEIGKRYGRTPAADPEDVLSPAPAGPQADKPAASPFSVFSEETAFCGGKGGDPGPCPEDGSKDQPEQAPHPHAGVAGVPEALSAAVESAKSRKELAQAVSATVNEAKAKVKQSVAGAIQGIRTEELGQYKGALQSALHSAIREHVGDFGRDLIGHLSHEARYTVGQLKGGETKDQIRQAMGTAHDELGPQGVADKWQFNSRYLREDLAKAFAAHGHNPQQAATATEGIIASLGKRLGVGQAQHSEEVEFCQSGTNKGKPGPCPKDGKEETSDKPPIVRHKDQIDAAATKLGLPAGSGLRPIVRAIAERTGGIAAQPRASDFRASLDRLGLTGAGLPEAAWQEALRSGYVTGNLPASHTPPAGPAATPAATPKPPPAPRLPRPTAEEALDHINRVKAAPTPENVAAVAQTLSRMKVKDVVALKKSLGIRAGGAKAALTQKVASEATRRLSIREQYVRQARMLGYSVKDLTQTAQTHRRIYNDLASETGRMVQDARRQYEQLTQGGRLHRGMTAFKTGDYTEIPHFDQIAESLQRSYPELLPGDAQEGYERLYTILQAGPPARMGYQDSLEHAMDEFRALGPQSRRPRTPATASIEEELPFTEFAEGSEGSSDPDQLQAILDAMVEGAENPDLLSVLAEMAGDGPEVSEDEDTTPPDPAAQAKVAGWLNEAVQRKRNEEGRGS